MERETIAPTQIRKILSLLPPHWLHPPTSFQLTGVFSAAAALIPRAVAPLHRMATTHRDQEAGALKPANAHLLSQATAFCERFATTYVVMSNDPGR